jgi:hypothetical protein
VTAPLQSEYKATNAEVFLRAWLLPIVTTSPSAAGVGSKLWTPSATPVMPLPYRAVRRVTGPRTRDGDYPLMRVHTFASTYSLAAVEADKTDSRVQVLVDYPGWPTTLTGGVVYCEWAEITEAAYEEPYGAESVCIRFVSEYRFGLSFTPA